MQLGEEGLNAQLRHVFLRLALLTNNMLHHSKVCTEERVAGAKDLFLEEGIELAELASPIVARQDSTACSLGLTAAASKQERHVLTSRSPAAH